MAPVILPASMSVATPVKSLPRRPTLKRNASEMGSDGDSIPSGLSKRPKVSFDTDVKVRVLGEEWEKEPSIIREEVRRAIEKHKAGDSSSYNRLKSIYISNTEAGNQHSATEVKNHTLALYGHVSRLDKSCSDLVFTVLESNWIGRDEQYVSLFVKFLGNIVSAQSGFIGGVLEMLVGKLGQIPLSAGQISDFPSVKRSQLQSRAHSALQYILALVPAASSILAPILSKNFPIPSDTTKAHVIYTKNLLKIIAYTPELRSHILSLITDKLVKIDVEVQVDMDDLEDEVGEDMINSITQMPINSSELFDDVDDVDDDDTESILSDESIDADEERRKQLKFNIEKMDIIMDIMFDYYKTMFTAASFDVREHALEHLFRQFTNIILPTYRSRHTQFLLFHFSQTSPTLIKHFTSACSEIIIGKNRPAHLKRSAAAYLASFVARGARVPAEVVRDIWNVLSIQLHKLRAEYESTDSRPNLRRYPQFYSIAQALLYIFCFRWRDLIIERDSFDDEEEEPFAANVENLNWIPGVKGTLETIKTSKLNPLKICSPPIVMEFARLAYNLKVVYAISVVESNKHLHLPRFQGLGAFDPILGELNRETALDGKDDEALNQLDSYFPFDPYNLPRSKRWIEGFYLEWKGVGGTEDTDKNDDDDDDDDEDDDEDDD